MVELNPTVREQEIYEEMELTPEMVLRSCPALTRAWTPARSARPTVGMTMLLCTGKSGTALCHRGGDNTPH